MLRLENISKTFSPGTAKEIRVLDDVRLTLEDGDFAVLLGVNGSGKSTLLKIISGEVEPDDGRVLFDEIDLSRIPSHRRARFLSYVPQGRDENLVSSLTVLETFMLAMSRGQSALMFLRSQKWQAELAALLGSVGGVIGGRMDEQIRTLSGGEHQLLSVLFSAEMIRRGYRKGVLLLDEHVVHLDPRASKVVMSLTAELVKRYELTTLMVTHNVQIAAEYGNRILIMGNRRIAFDRRYSSGERPQPAALLDAMSTAYA